MKRSRKKRRKGNKGKALRVHSFRRAVERYDLDLTDELRKEITGKIQRSESIPVESQSLRVSVHDVKLNTGETVRVAYDKKRGQIITFLHQDPKDYMSSMVPPSPSHTAKLARFVGIAHVLAEP